ncbi:hypothetical protein AOT81_11800 [Xylella fastidiosa]|nr:hypothetical protein AOT81_11800 [Xylella fastidiosa]
MKLSLQCRQVFGEAAFLRTGRGQPITHRKTGEWLPNTWVWVIQFERIELRTHVCLNTAKNDSVMEVA